MILYQSCREELQNTTENKFKKVVDKRKEICYYN